MYKVVSEEQAYTQNITDSITLEEAMTSPHAEMLREAKREELNNFHSNHTFELFQNRQISNLLGANGYSKEN